MSKPVLYTRLAQMLTFNICDQTSECGWKWPSCIDNDQRLSIREDCR